MLAALLLLLALAVVPPLIGGYLLHALAGYLISGLLALSVGLLVGYGRLPTLGGGVAFGAGAYAVATLSFLGIGQPLLALLASVLAGVAVGLPFALYAVVAGGVEYLMLTYLTVFLATFIPAMWIVLPPGTIRNGPSLAFGLDPLHGPGFYWLVLGAVALCVAAAWLLVASPAGRVMQAIGRNPVRLSAMGYRVWLYRTTLTLFASAIGAIGGWLYALQTDFVTTQLLGQSTSVQGLSGALIGGVDTILGPLLGSTLLNVLDNQLSRGSTESSLFLGAALILSLLLMPDGILGRLQNLARRWQRSSAL